MNIVSDGSPGGGELIPGVAAGAGGVRGAAAVTLSRLFVPSLAVCHTNPIRYCA